MDAYTEICSAIDSYREKVVALSHEIHEHPELKFQERFASELLTRAVRELGGQCIPRDSGSSVGSTDCIARGDAPDTLHHLAAHLCDWGRLG